MANGNFSCDEEPMEEDYCEIVNDCSFDEDPNPKLPESSSEIIDATKVIDTIEDSKRVCNHLMEHHQIIALELKGRDLDCAQGKISLIVIGTCNGQCLIFDVHSNNQMVCRGRIKALLQCKNIIKVVHECCLIKTALQNLYGLTLRGIFDTQCAHAVIEGARCRKNPRFITAENLNFISLTYGRGFLTPARHTVERMYMADCNFWDARPLTCRKKEYAARCVLALLPEVYNNMNNRLKGPLREMFREFCNGKCFEPPDHDVRPPRRPSSEDCRSQSREKTCPPPRRASPCERRCRRSSSVSSSCSTTCPVKPRSPSRCSSYESAEFPALKCRKPSPKPCKKPCKKPKFRLPRKQSSTACARRRPSGNVFRTTVLPYRVSSSSSSCGRKRKKPGCKRRCARSVSPNRCAKRSSSDISMILRQNCDCKNHSMQSSESSCLQRNPRRRKRSACRKKSPCIKRSPCRKRSPVKRLINCACKVKPKSPCRPGSGPKVNCACSVKPKPKGSCRKPRKKCVKILATPRAAGTSRCRSPAKKKRKCSPSPPPPILAAKKSSCLCKTIKHPRLKNANLVDSGWNAVHEMEMDEDHHYHHQKKHHSLVKTGWDEVEAMEAMEKDHVYHHRNYPFDSDDDEEQQEEGEENEENEEEEEDDFENEMSPPPAKRKR